jgi:hypothetical protein
MTIHNITRQEAESAREYHQLLTRQDDPSLPNAQTFKHNVWRVSGKLKTWKRNPERFEQPVKFGMYQSSVITDQPDTTGLTGFVLTADTCHVCKLAGSRIGTAKVQRQQRDSTQSEITYNGITIRVRYIVVK